MRLAIVSDIHGNRRALEAVLSDLRQVSPDLVWHGGDLAANGAHPAEIIDAIRFFGWPGVCGNTDEMLWAPERLIELAALQPKLKAIIDVFQEMIPTTCAWIGEERIGWLESLPRMYSQGEVTLVHASPNDLWRAPLANARDSVLRSAYGPLSVPLVVYGHIHRPYIRALPELTVANTGSVSLSYDGDQRASYLLIDDRNVTIRRVEYDFEGEAIDLLDSELRHADWLCRILRTGRYCPPA
jgi:putative phosphoesterase